MSIFIFDESFLHVGDIITKANGQKFMVSDQTINHYRYKRFLRPSEVVKVIITHLCELKKNRYQEVGKTL